MRVSQVGSMSDRYMENHSGSRNVYGMHRLLRDVTLAFNSVNLLLWPYVTFKTSDDFLLLKYETDEDCYYRSPLHPYCFMVKTWWREKKFHSIISSSIISWTEMENSETYGIQIQRKKMWNCTCSFMLKYENCPYCSKSSLIQNIFFHEHFKLRFVFKPLSLLLSLAAANVGLSYYLTKLFWFHGLSKQSTVFTAYILLRSLA